MLLKDVGAPQAGCLAQPAVLPPRPAGTPLHYGPLLFTEIYLDEWTELHMGHAHCLKCIFWILMSQSFLELESQTLPLLSFLILKNVFSRWKKCVLFFGPVKIFFMISVKLEYFVMFIFYNLNLW